MEIPARGTPNLKGLAEDCWAILLGQGYVIFPASDHAAPAPRAIFQGPRNFSRSWSGDVWERLAVPTLDSFQAPWTSPIPTPIQPPTFDQVYAQVLYFNQSISG